MHHVTTSGLRQGPWQELNFRFAVTSTRFVLTGLIRRPLLESKMSRYHLWKRSKMTRWHLYLSWKSKMTWCHTLKKPKMTRCHRQFYYPSIATMNRNAQKLHLHSIHKGILGVCDCQTYRNSTQTAFEIEDVTVSSLTKLHPILKTYTLISTNACISKCIVRHHVCWTYCYRITDYSHVERSTQGEK